MMSSSFLLTKSARILGGLHFQSGSLRPLHKSSIFNKHIYSKTLRTSPTVARMEEAAPRTRASSSVSGGGERNGEIDRFELSPSSVLKLQKGDITVWFVDGSTDAIDCVTGSDDEHFFPTHKKCSNSRRTPFPSGSLRPLHKSSIFNKNIYSKTLRTSPTVTRMEEVAPRARASSSVSGGGERNCEIDRFELSPSSVLKLQKGDITVWFVDGSTNTIVNAANERMLGGGGVDGAIHRAAGPELRVACLDVPEVRPGVRCPTGEARITPAFQLPVYRVIHTVGPIYDVDPQPEVSLRNAYRNSLRLAKENDIQYIAFPAISCGVYGYPFNEASRIAISTIKEFSNDFKEVHFVLFSDDIYRAWLETARELL